MFKETLVGADLKLELDINIRINAIIPSKKPNPAPNDRILKNALNAQILNKFRILISITANNAKHANNIIIIAKTKQNTIITIVTRVHKKLLS